MSSRNLRSKTELLIPEIANYVKKSATSAKLSLSEVKFLPYVLLELAEQIAELTGSWNPVEIFTPDNTKVEKAKFIEAFTSNSVYNPHFIYTYAENFEYNDSQKSLRLLLSRVRSFTPQTRVERLAKIALYFKILDDLATCELVEGIQKKDEGKIGRALEQKYPKTNQALLNIARESYAEKVLDIKVRGAEQQGLLTRGEMKFLLDKQFDAAKIKEAFTWALDQYGMLSSGNDILGFSVVIDEKATAIDVRDKSINGPTIFIPAEHKVNGINLIKLIGHEIEGHARQSVNGKRLFFIGGGALKVDNEILYEGLAKRYDDILSKKLFGTSEGVPLPYYTFAVYAAEVGKSFYDIFHDQVNIRLRVAINKQFSDNLPALTEIEQKIVSEVINSSWATTYRVMRGHTDTTNPYKFAMAKDLAYLLGYITDKQLVESGVGYVNEAAIIASGGLQLLAEFELEEDYLPLSYQDVATKYCRKVLMDQSKDTSIA